MKLSDIATAAALAAERETLTTLSAGADVTVEVNQKNRHAFTFDDATAKIVFSQPPRGDQRRAASPRGRAGVKIFVGIPCGAGILPTTTMCLVGVVASTQLHAIVTEQDTYCDRSHNGIVEHALKLGSDAIMFIDSDQEFPAHTINRLAAHKKDIVGCAYRRRQPPFPLMPDSTGDETGLREVEWLPSGVMLVRASVFEKIPFPWFPNLYGKKGEDFVGSDRSFCRKARGLAGLSIFCDYDLSREVTHIASVALAFDGTIKSVGG